MSLLAWKDISFAYDTFAIDRLNYELSAGDFTLFFGPNGAGKTTLFKLAVGLLKPKTGAVFIEGKAIQSITTFDIAKQIAYLEQETQYIFPFTVEEIVLMGRFPHNADHIWDRKEDLEIAAWAMEATGTLRFAKRSIVQLSGGERRKVEIARALCQKPKLFLLDEPAIFLDIRQQIDLFETLKRLNEEEHISIGLISHQLGLAKNFVKSAVFIEQGSVVDSGSPESMITSERIGQWFGLTSSQLSSTLSF